MLRACVDFELLKKFFRTTENVNIEDSKSSACDVHSKSITLNGQKCEKNMFGGIV